MSEEQPTIRLEATMILALSEIGDAPGWQAETDRQSCLQCRCTLWGSLASGTPVDLCTCI